MNKSMRELKFRIWNKTVYPDLVKSSVVSLDNTGWININRETNGGIELFTGLKDKNGTDIYEFSEINNKYRIVYKAPSYVLKDISNGDIVQIYEQDQLEVTREYSPMEEN
jgi:hypothetical protein